MSFRKKSEVIEQQEQQQLHEAKNFENLLKKAGDSNLYQFITIIIYLVQWLITVYVIIGPLYFLGSPDFLCSDGSKCNEKEGCKQGAVIYPGSKKTMTTDFKMYCGDSNFRSYAGSIIFAGSVCGDFLITYLAERKGRRILMIWSWGVSTVGIILASFSVNKWMLLPSLFFTGFGLPPCNSLNMILINEQSGEKFRQKATTILLMSWSTFAIFLAGTVYLINDWRTIYIYILAIQAALIFFANFYVCESPMFLYSLKADDQLAETINDIAKKNRKKDIPQDFVQEVIEERNVIEKTKKNQEAINKKYNFWDLFLLKSLRNISIASCFSMFAMQFVYYTTQLSLDNLGSNTYVNAVIVALGETLSLFICNLFIEKLPRKVSTMAFMGACNVMCLLSFATRTVKALQTVNAALIRVANCMTTGILAVYVQELYPTPTRSLGIGMQMGIGLIGSTLAPYSVQLFQKMGIPEMGGVGVLMIPFNFFNLLYMETKGQKLKDVVEEDEEQNYENEGMTSEEKDLKYLSQQEIV